MRNNEWTTTIIERKIEGKPGWDRPRIPFMKDYRRHRKKPITKNWK